MSLAFVATRARRDRATTTSAEAHERSVRRRLAIVWGLLCVNALTFYAGFPLLVPIPHLVGQIITQGALPVALIAALTVNRRVILRPNVFLCLVSLLALSAIILFPVWPIGRRFGDLYRVIRLTEFVATLWLLTPWWGRRDLLLLRYHLTALSVVLGSVVLGIVLHPGAALGGGRLTGVIWPIPSTEVAHYAAIISGVVIVLWLGRLLTGQVALLVTVVAGTILFIAHTRTALGAMVAGVIVAGLSLVPASSRTRKFLLSIGVTASITVPVLAGILTTWLARGESGHLLHSFSGRTVFWAMVVDTPRTTFQMLFGFGLTANSINGLPIDSNWFSAYMQQGLFGVAVCAMILIALFAIAFFHPSGTSRALALFLMTYSLVASVTQVGFVNPSTYLLELAVAASLLVTSAAQGDKDRPDGRTPRRFTWLANRRSLGRGSQNRWRPAPYPRDAAY